MTAHQTRTFEAANDWLDELRGIPAIRPGRFAQISGMARSSVYDAIHNGTLPSITIGRTLYLPTVKLLEIFGVAESPVGTGGAETGPDGA